MLGANGVRKGVLVIVGNTIGQHSQLIQSFRRFGAIVISETQFQRMRFDGRQFDCITVFCDFDEFPITFEFVSKCFALLSLGGACSFRRKAALQDDESTEELEKMCLYSGFIDVSSSTVTPSEDKVYFSKVICKRPIWDLGESYLLDEGYTVATEDASLIDESLLVDENETYEPLGKGKESCATKPRACANCSCGRAELEVQLGAEEAKRRLENGTMRSSCGSCYLGDAFRCSSCPYKGLPAFKPGEKVLLDLDRSNTGQTDLLDREAIGFVSGSRITINI